MSVAPMSRQTKRDKLRLSPEKRQKKKNLVHKGLKKMKISELHQPFNTQENTGVPFHRNFNSILRRYHQKISYERRAYESVDEKSLS